MPDYYFGEDYFGEFPWPGEVNIYPSISRKPDYGTNIERIDNTFRIKTEAGYTITRSKFSFTPKTIRLKYENLKFSDVQLFEVLETSVKCSEKFYWVNLAEAYDTEKWEANKYYGVGNIIRPTVLNGHSYRCLAAGTSLGTEPTWPDWYSGEVIDGSIIWIENTYQVKLSKPIQYIPKSYGIWSVTIEIEISKEA